MTVVGWAAAIIGAAPELGIVIGPAIVGLKHETRYGIRERVSVS